jgi:MFS family permease
MLVYFFGFGIAAGLWAGSVPFVSAAAHMTTGDVGMAFTLFTAGYIGSMTIAGKILSLAAPRRILMLSVPVLVIVLAGLLQSVSSLQMILCLTAVGIVMGLMDLVMNTEGTLVEADLQRPILARLHCFASLGIGIGAIAGSVFALTAGPIASVALNTAALGLAFIAVALATPDRSLSGKVSGGLLAAYSPSILTLGVIFGIGAAGETSASIWSAQLLADQAPWLAVIAGIGVTFFAFCQVVVRAMGDRLRRMLGDGALLTLSLLVGAAGFAIVGASSSFAMSVAGFAAVGVGTAMQMPCIVALAAFQYPRNGGAALSLIAAIAGLPRFVAPWAMGEIASRSSTPMAFAAVAAAFLIAIGLAALTTFRQRAGAA